MGEAPDNPLNLIKPANPQDTPLIKYMQDKAKGRKAKAEKRAKKWAAMESIHEEKATKSSWTCAECGTTKNLEEDPDDRGTCYCQWCWESWESMPAKKKKKKKKGKYDEEDWEEEEEDTSKKKKKKKDKADDSDSKWRTNDDG